MASLSLPAHPGSCYPVVVWSLSHVLLFCNLMDHSSPPGSSVHGISRARILEWVAIPFSRGIFLTQGSNLDLLHCRWILYYLSHQGGLNYFEMIFLFMLVIISFLLYFTNIFCTNFTFEFIKITLWPNV